MKSTFKTVRVFTLLFSIFAVFPAFSQLLESVSVFSITGSPNYQGGFAVDNFGNVLTSFKVHNAVEFPDGTFLGGVGGEAKIIKFNPEGVRQWGLALGNSQCSTYDIQISPANEIYVSGYQSYDFFPDSIDPNGDYNFSHFIAKMDQNGTFTRVIRFPGVPQFSVQENGNIAFALQTTTGNLFLGDEPMQFGQNKFLYGELNAAGDVLWYEIDDDFYSSTGTQRIVFDCVARNGKLYYHGQFTGTTMVGNTSLTLGNSSTTGNGYIAEIDLATHQITKAVKVYNLTFKDMDVDSENNIYLSAQHNNTAQVSAFMGTVYAKPAKDDGYIFKINSDFTQHLRHDVCGFSTSVSGYVWMGEIAIHDDDLYSISAFNNSGNQMYIGNQNYPNTSKTFVTRYNADLTFRSSAVFEYENNSPPMMQLASNDNRLYMRSKTVYNVQVLPGTPLGYREFIGTLRTDLNRISGRAYKDFNMDGIFNAGDIPLTGNIVSTDPEALMSITNPDGTYDFYVDSGEYMLQIENAPNYYTKQPLSANIDFNGLNQVQNIDLTLIPVPGAHDVSIDFYSLKRVLPGDDAKHRLLVTNTGTFPESGTVRIDPLHYSLPLPLVTTSPATYQDQQYLAYDFDDLAPGDSFYITIDYPNIPIQFLDILGEEVFTSAMVDIEEQDIYPADNTAAFECRVVAAYDPNMKEVNRQDSINLTDLPQIEDFSYTIHFQNEGNAPAQNVLVEDEISDLLVLGSLQILDYSHPMRAEIHDRKVKFFFDDIELPAKSADEAGSKGFVHFKLKRIPDLALNDSITNQAFIFFDYNPAIITNKTVNRIVILPMDPVAADDEAQTPFNTAVSVNITENDLDEGTIDVATVDLDQLTAGIQSSATTPSGSWIVNASGELTFTPAPGFSGNASITYTVQDGDGITSNPAMVTITVNPGFAPQAVNDASETPFNTPVVVDLTGNDSDQDGTIDISTVDLNQSATGIQASATTAEGTWNVNASGELTFTPAAGFSGNASIAYAVKDNDGIISNVATVTITVNPGFAPLAVDDEAETPFNTPVVVDLTGNDSDEDGTIDISTVDLDQSATGIQASATTASGSWNVNASSELTFTPVAGFSGDAAITYSVADNDGIISNVATVTITVNPGFAPLAVDDEAQTPFNTPVVVDVATNDSDEDGTIDVSTIDLDELTAGIQSWATTAEGSWNAYSIGKVTFTPQNGFEGIAQIEYTIKDNHGLVSNLAKIIVTVNPDENVGLETLNDPALFKVYPNPATNEINVQVPQGKSFKVRIFSLSGTIVLNQDALQTIDISKIATGIYQLELVENGNEVRFRTKVVKN